MDDSDTESHASSSSSVLSMDAGKFSPVLEWYNKLFSRRVDIVGDFAGSELFLIEGDSLLLKCFSDEHLDFEPGFQLLHACYLVESFLRGLSSRQCNFHIAFFDNLSELCVPQHASGIQREKFLLARACIIRHLQANLQNTNPDIEVHKFSSVQSPAFTEYLRTTEHYFILLHDGASSETLRKKTILSKDSEALEAEGTASEEEDTRLKIKFRLLINWFMSQGYNAALVNGLEWRDTKVVTAVLELSKLSVLDHSLITGAKDEESTTKKGTISGPQLQSGLDRISSISGSDLTERELLTILVLSRMGVDDGEVDAHAAAYLRHISLLAQCPLTERVVELSTIPESISAFLAKFSVFARQLLDADAWGEKLSQATKQHDVYDLVDGRIFAACLTDTNCGNTPLYKQLIDALASFADADPPASNGSQQLQSNGTRTNNQPATPQVYKVLPFSNEVFDAHLASIQLATDNKASETPEVTSAQIFREVSHWHNSKRPLDPKTKTDRDLRTAKIEAKARRRNQWFLAEMTAYSASLTNAVGKVLDPEIITTGAGPKPAAARLIEKKPEAKPKAPAKAKKGGAKGKQAIMDEIAATRSQKEDVTAEKVLQGWRSTCTSLAKESSVEVRYQKAKQYLSTLPPAKRVVVEAEAKLYVLNILLELWISYCRKGSKSGDGLSVAALVYDAVKSLAEQPSKMTKTVATCLKTAIKALRLPQLDVTSSDSDRPLAFEFVLQNTVSVDLTIPLPVLQFQLLHCAPYFDRSIDSAPDPRVPFEPDGWQRKVLDEIDARRSLLVIAPTSAGKTFISFYAMRQVLQSSEDDILVYVAPTKALVNQIAAEVQARFSKTYKYPGHSVWGIHTRDYRINNPTGCQILVTVPAILQIMLLAPGNAKGWSRRIKWIIFDEVHCIGQAEDGLIWEQLLLLAPCPIIALSATIGNPQAFNGWLQSSQQAAGHEFTMVQHSTRYSDLRKFVYSPPKDFKFEGLSDRRAFAKLGLDGVPNFSFVHPGASLINRKRGMPEDFSLEARDCMTLWESMNKHQTKEHPLDKSLDPATALPPVIKKIDILKWEKSLKDVLKEWLHDENSPFNAVYRDLSQPLDHLQQRDLTADRLRDTTLPLLVSLHEQDALPAILFNYDRSACEKICQSLLARLIAAEDAWKESSPKWKARLRNWEDYKKAVAKAGKRAPPKISKKKGGGGDDDEGFSKDDMMRDAASSETNPLASFNPEDPVEGFHFADNKKLTKEEFNNYIRELVRRGVPSWLIDTLRRGIAPHHAGLNRKYRQVVEVLFRKGYLRVIVATGTLALGINMPAKTTVFSGDSVFLTALAYRQAAGRAGRRGFDMLGNVVFQGISLQKIFRLMSSRLPDLNGHFPITTTLVLRLFGLLDESANSPFAVRSINALLSQPRLYLGGEEAKMTVLHHLRFSIEYLRRQYLLNARGQPLNFSGIVGHLYFTENASFAFHALLKGGYFHRLCAKIDTSPEPVLRELMLTMAHLFGRQHLKFADAEFVEQVVKRSPSIVFLPRMPQDAATVLSGHNDSVLQIYTAYVRTFVDQHVAEPDNSLPLTQIKVGSNDTSASAQHLPSQPPTTIRSSFVALSGHSDKFKTIHDLCATVRSGVFLEEAVVPYVGLYPDETNIPLNAYLYDFYIHGVVEALVKANRIRRGDVWFVLNDFSMVLATLVTSLSNFMKLTADSDLDLTDVMGGGEEADEAKEDKMMPDQDSGYETASTTSMPVSGKAAPTTALPTRTKKKKVADSWDDSDEDESEEEKEENKEDVFEEKPAWEEGEGLLKVLKAFKMLKEEFDTKFRAMWA